MLKKPKTIVSVKRKKPENIRLFMPLFLDDDAVLSTGKIDIDISQILAGNCLYGDDSKREGLADAYTYAKKNKKVIRVLDVNISLFGSVQGQHRLDESDLLSGKYGMLRYERYSTKADLADTVSSLIEERAKTIHPNLRKRKADEWLQLDPSLARVLFERYPISLVIVNSHVPYSKRIFSVAVIKEQGWQDKVSANLLYLKNVKVNLVE